jgi:hypothetical protein
MRYHFWNNHMTFGTGDTFGAKLVKGEGKIMTI